MPHLIYILRWTIISSLKQTEFKVIPRSNLFTSSNHCMNRKYLPIKGGTVSKTLFQERIDIKNRHKYLLTYQHFQEKRSTRKNNGWIYRPSQKIFTTHKNWPDRADNSIFCFIKKICISIQIIERTFMNIIDSPSYEHWSKTTKMKTKTQKNNITSVNVSFKFLVIIRK